MLFASRSFGRVENCKRFSFKDKSDTMFGQLTCDASLLCAAIESLLCMQVLSIIQFTAKQEFKAIMVRLRDTIAHTACAAKMHRCTVANFSRLTTLLVDYVVTDAGFLHEACLTS